MFNFSNKTWPTRPNAKLLGFGFLMALGSSFGQTYFIGVFGPEIREEFDLTRERVRQIKEKAIQRLRHRSRSKNLRRYLG